jgi:integrase/recombinase XerD
MDIVQTLPLSIKFILKNYPQRERLNYPVHVQLIYKREKASISLKMISTLEDWDIEQGQYTANRQFNLVRNKKLKEVREYLLSLFFEAQKSGLPISVQQIKQRFKGEEVVVSQLLFTDYFRDHIAELREKKSEYSIGTINHYVKTQTHLHRFLKLNGWTNLKLNEFNKKLLERFEHYLLITPNAQTGRPMNGNTSTTYIRKIKASVNVAIRKDLMQVNPFQGFKIKSFKQANKVFLTTEELELIKQHDLGGNLSLQRVKDVFLFSCHTGLRHSDVCQLTDRMISRDSDGLLWISLTQQKTKDVVDIPMLDYASKIYMKYEDYRKANNGAALPVLSNQKINAALKVIANLVGITKNISFHSGRHTFATLSLELGVDLKTVSGLLGHTSIKSTEIYAKLTRKKKGDAIKFLNVLNNASDKAIADKALLEPAMNETFV